MHNIFSMLCFIISSKVKMQLKCKKKDLRSIWRRCCDWMNVSGVICKFCAGDFFLDAPWSGRPAEVNSNQINTLIENNQHSTMQEIAHILKIFKSIKLLVKMKNMSFTFWKPYRLFGQPNISMGIKVFCSKPLGFREVGFQHYCDNSWSM